MGINQQETRVRMSAEGMAEIVGAFQKVAGEGKKAGKETAEAFKQLNEQFREIGKNLVGGLSFVVAADKLKELFNQTLEGAEGLERLSKQTGLSTDAIQGFQRAARETGISTETANTGIEKFTLSIGKAEIGSKQTAAALADLGLSSRQLNALAPDERLQLVAQRLSQVTDQATRARVEIALFGRSSQELDQTLVKVGEQGLGAFIAKARELGTFLDEDMIGKLVHVKDQLRDLGDQTRGLGTQLLVGMAPALGDVAASFTKATNAGEGFRAVGEIIGNVIKGLALILETVGKALGADWALLMNHLESAAVVSVLTAQGHLIEAGKEVVRSFKEDGRIANEFAADVADSWKKLLAAEERAKANESAGGEGGNRVAADDAFSRALLKTVTERLDAELKLTEAHNQLLLEKDKQLYDSGAISLQEYFKRREALTNADFDKRIATAKARLADEQALAATPATAAEEEDRVTAQLKTQGEIDLLQAQRKVAILKEQNELHTQTEAIERRQQEAQIKLLELEGKRADAARQKLKLDSDDLAKVLAASNAPKSEIDAAVGTAEAQGEAKISFDENHRKAQSDLLSLETQRKAIQDQVNTGQLFSIQGQQKILDLDRERLPLLQQEAAAQLELARQTGDGSNIAAAEAFKEKIDQIAASTDTAGQQMAQLKAGIESSVGQGFSTFLDDAIRKSKSLGQSFDDATKQIIADLIKMAIQIEEQKFLKALFSGSLLGGGGTQFTSGSSSVTDTGGGTTTQFSAHAAGGLIRGPGSTTSDSIPALLSDKEFVVNAQATGRPGVLGFLHALNEGIGSPRFRVPQLAGGGAVSASLGSTSFVGAAGKIGQPIQLHVAPEALHLTLRDWFEGEVARINSTR